MGVAVDITERAEAERQVRSARDYLHTITNSMGEGLFTMDTEGRLIYLNRAGERLLGWRQDELAGRNVHEATHYRRPDGSDYPIAECPLMAACRDGGSVRLEDEVFIRKDGTEMPVEIVAEPFETEGGVRGSVVVFGDITERRRGSAGCAETWSRSCGWAGCGTPSRRIASCSTHSRSWRWPPGRPCSTSCSCACSGTMAR